MNKYTYARYGMARIIAMDDPRLERELTAEDIEKIKAWWDKMLARSIAPAADMGEPPPAL